MENLKLLAFLPLILLACSSPDTSSQSELSDQMTVAKDLNLSDWKKGLESADDPILLDVRTPEEVQDGIIPGAINFDFYSDSFQSDIGDLDKNRPVYVYCRSGGRSGKAMDMMAKMGFQEVYNLEGGYLGYSEQ